MAQATHETTPLAKGRATIGEHVLHPSLTPEQRKLVVALADVQRTDVKRDFHTAPELEVLLAQHKYNFKGIGSKLHKLRELGHLQSRLSDRATESGRRLYEHKALLEPLAVPEGNIRHTNGRRSTQETKTTTLRRELSLCQKHFIEAGKHLRNAICAEMEREEAETKLREIRDQLTKIL